MKEIVYYLLSLMLSYCTISSNSILFVVSDPRFSSVHQFHRVPFAEDKKIVLDTKLLQISGTQCPYNASIVKENNGYIISFREDLKPKKHKKGVALSWVKLDQNFQQVEMSRFFNTKHIGAEDGRLFYYQEKLFLLYTYPIVNKSINRLFIPPDHYYSTPANMRQALVNIDQEGNIFNTTELRYGNQRIEKNWTPFEYKDENGHSHLYFIYKFNPREIICLTKSGKMEQVIPAAPHSRILWNLWEKCWGEIRGGTPALLIDGKYLTFFHSFFLDNEKRFYIFGALIFENKPPFQIKKISPYPIMFRECYTTNSPYCISCGLFLRNVIFPCGFVPQKQENKEVFHVLCGENDHAIRLITIDKQALFKNMRKIDVES